MEDTIVRIVRKREEVKVIVRAKRWQWKGGEGRGGEVGGEEEEEEEEEVVGEV